MLLLACALPALADDLAPADPRNAPGIGVGHALGGTLDDGASLTTLARVRLTPGLAVDPGLGFVHQVQETGDPDGVQTQEEAVTTWWIEATPRFVVSRPGDTTVSLLARASWTSQSEVAVANTDSEGEETQTSARSESRWASASIGVGAEWPVARRFSVGLDLTSSIASYTLVTLAVDGEDTWTGHAWTFGLQPAGRIVFLFWP